MVAYEPGVSADEARAVEAASGASLLERIGPDARLLRVRPGAVPATVARLTADGRVRYAEPDYFIFPTATPDDSDFGLQWALNNTGQEYRPNWFGTPGADIDALRAWDITTGSADVVVGVIDSGISLSHPDLVDNLWSNPSPGILGCPPGTHGYDFVADDCTPQDTQGHGTAAAGVIGAVGDNGEGVAGVAWDVSLMGLRVFSDESLFPDPGVFSKAAAAVWWAIDARQAGVNVRVLSMSFGGEGYSAALRDAIAEAGSLGILAVAGAGNDGRDLDAGSPFQPCAYDLDNLICVAATASEDQMTPGSDWGTTSVDLGAPGENIRTTANSGYTYFGATSGATPHVAGAAALVWSEFPSLTPQQVKAKILNNVDPLPSLQGKTVTGGRLNLYGALTGPIGETPTTTTTPPSTSPTSVPPGGGWSGGSGGSQPGNGSSGSGGAAGSGGSVGSSAPSNPAIAGGSQPPKGSAPGDGRSTPAGSGPARGGSRPFPGGFANDVFVAGESLGQGSPPQGGARVTYDDDPSSRGSGWALAVGTALAGLGLASVGLWHSRAGRFRGHLAESVQLARPL